MGWTWDPRKNHDNKRNHGLSFETAVLVFDDPHAASSRNPYPDEERWQTLGMVGNVLLLVIHTWSARETGGHVGRIISARKATTRERRLYEEET